MSKGIQYRPERGSRHPASIAADSVTDEDALPQPADTPDSGIPFTFTPQ